MIHIKTLMYLIKVEDLTAINLSCEMKWIEIHMKWKNIQIQTKQIQNRSFQNEIED